MSYLENLNRPLVFCLIVALLSGIVVAGGVKAVQAREERFESRRESRREFRDDSRRGSGRDSRREIRRSPVRRDYEFHDSRYRHDRRYPVRGRFVEVVPRDHRIVVHRGTRFFFSGGVWYRPERSRFVVVAPPIGLVIPFLPPYYTTIWIGSVPYFYANDVYYTRSGGGYAIVEPPVGEVNQVAPPPSDQLFIYPRLGQGEDEQAKDRYECHQWAVDQTRYDPTKPPVNLSEEQVIQERADYQRAMGVCLDARGYSVK